MKQNIYFDNAATTAVRKEVFAAMKPFFEREFGNPSSVYEIARNAKRHIEDARLKVAKAIGAEPEEIYFTGSGTEADNWAIKGAADANKNRGRHIITSVIEHHAVLHTCEYLEKNGFDVTYLPVNEHGIIEPEELKKAMRPETIVVSLMFANNEIGTIQPIKELAEITKSGGAIFHTDAVQAVGHVEIDVKEMNIDMLALSGHKLGAPKGVGALYIKKGTKIEQFIHGGGQERRKRGGTENVAGIVGLAVAVELASVEIEDERKRLEFLRDKLIKGIEEKIPHIRVNGHREKRLPGNVNVSFEFIEGESLLLHLDMSGIFASSGSACTSGDLDPSHVLLAIGLPHEIAHGSLRLTVGRDNTESDVDKVLEVLPGIVQRLRDMSPLYNPEN
ncbi:MAG: cysteine desulfurase NifS [Defluviitaleaceae bacterium]|nr:cysteine desulfurase NifS [Defluviitaleaceae bacterium]